MEHLKPILTFVVSFFCLGIQAQIKHDYIWFSGGFDPEINGREYFTLDFNKPKNQIFTKYEGVFDKWVAHNNSSVANSNGKLAFVTNGCAILGRDFNKITDQFEIDDFDCSYGYPIMGSSLLLPDNIDTTLYHLINLRMEWGSPPLIVFNKYLKQSLLESSPTGLQYIKKNNEVIVEDTFANPITAVKHGNGTDWWIFTQKLGGNFYRTLLTPNGFEPAQYQEVGPYYGPKKHGIYMTEGQMCFSPNGKHFATYYEAYGLCLYDFDRCTGLLSNPKLMFLDTSEINRAGGVAFSQDSRFLYCFSWRVAYQLDLNNPQIEQNMIVLDSFDGFESPTQFLTSFWQPRLAPDGQIYIGTAAGTDYWHIIEFPNKLGKDCNFKQHALKMPTYCGSPPNMPYYRSGAFLDSPCDTLSPKNPDTTVCEISYFPNPVDGILNIEVCHSATEYEVYDIVGRRIFEGSKTTGPEILHVSTKEWPAGTYILRDKASKKAEKFMVLH